MPKLNTTAGQLLVNELLPAGLRDYNRQIDKGSLNKVLSRLALESPEQYREVSHRLAKLGMSVADRTGGFSFGPQHLRMSEIAKQNRVQLQRELDQLLDDETVDPQTLNAKVIELAGRYMASEPKQVYQESVKEQNPLALQILSGSRGNAGNLASLRASSLLFADAKDEPVPIAVTRSYSQGLSPAQYWAATYGGRRSVMTTKLGIADSGYMGKQLVQAAHRLLVTAHDGPYDPNGPIRGMPTETSDPDNEGSLLAHPVGGYARNTILTPRILKELQKQGVGRILVRSPAVGGPEDGGIYARDAGIREFGRLPTRYENVGVSASQSIGERLSQVALSSKHSGGVAGGNKLLSGMPLFKALINTPKVVKGGASHAVVDGRVERFEDAPAGGQYVWIGDKRHYIAKGFDPQVKVGDTVEAGDVISDGIPNPSIVVQHKGIGEGRRYFTKLFGDSLKNAGIYSHRRNVELLARGLINHVELNDEVGEGIPGDILPYQALEATWEPRAGTKRLPLDQARGRYLERPVLHYSIGTPIRPSVAKDLQEFGIKDIDVHDDPPPFQSTMVRADTQLQHDPDFMTRMYGSHIRKSFLSAVHRGGTSDRAGTSFVPGLAYGVDFGRYGKVQTPKTAPPHPGWAAGEPEQTEVQDYKPSPPKFKAASTGDPDSDAMIARWRDRPKSAPPSACPACGSDETWHARTTGNGNTVCGACQHVFTDANYGKKTAAVKPKLAVTFDRPKGTKKTFNTPDGKREVIYPVDYGYFDDLFNPEDGEEADVFVGTGDLCGRFMKGDNLSGTWKPDERKWYVGLTASELHDVFEMYRDDGDKAEIPKLLRDHVKFDSIEHLENDVKLLPQKSQVKQADWGTLMPILALLGAAGVYNMPAIMQFLGLKDWFQSKPPASPEEQALQQQLAHQETVQGAGDTVYPTGNANQPFVQTPAGGQLPRLPDGQASNPNQSVWQARNQQAASVGQKPTWAQRAYDAVGSVGNVAAGLVGTAAGGLGAASTLPAYYVGGAARHLGMPGVADSLVGMQQGMADARNAGWDQASGAFSRNSTAFNDHMGKRIGGMDNGIAKNVAQKAYDASNASTNAALLLGTGGVAGRFAGAVPTAAAKFVASPYTNPAFIASDAIAPSETVLGNVPGLKPFYDPATSQQAGQKWQEWGNQYGAAGRFVGGAVGTAREFGPRLATDGLLFRNMGNAAGKLPTVQKAFQGLAGATGAGTATSLAAFGGVQGMAAGPSKPDVPQPPNAQAPIAKARASVPGASNTGGF